MKMNNEYIVITGGGSGIGKALAIKLAQNYAVLIVGRNLRTLEETQHLSPSNIKIVQADISEAVGRQLLLDTIPHNTKVKFLIHNAAIIEAIELKNIDMKSWRYQMAVNVEAPLFLTQLLLPLINDGGRILHLSSKLAHEACHGIGAHCMSKAALYMLYNCFKLELKSSNIHMGSLRPGAVDTPTQKKVRSFPLDKFPLLPTFQKLYKENKLQNPKIVANFIEWVLLNTTHEKFSESEWNIYDDWHHQFWLKEVALTDSVNLPK